MNKASNLYLMHHGIKGQKWGVRRFQNPDGSYTSAGKAKRNKSDFSDKKIAKKVAIGLGAVGVTAGGLYLANKVSAKKSIDDARKAVEEAKKLGDENLRIANKESKRISNPNISREEIRKSFNKVNDAANRSMNAEKKATKAVRNAENKNHQNIGDDDISSFPYRMTDEYMPHYGPAKWFNALKRMHPDIYEAEYKKADEHWDERRRKRADEQYGTWTPSPLEHADIYSNEYLAHHGIKGQKWGVRRFEDTNGHLTPAGKRRYYNALADKGDTLREKGVSDTDAFALTPKQKVAFLLTFPVSTPVALAVDIQQRKAIQASISREKDVKMAEVRRKNDELSARMEKRHNVIKKARDDAFHEVYGPNAKVDFNKIYKEMNADMSIEDSDYYKEIEEAWRKKHGFEPLNEIAHDDLYEETYLAHHGIKGMHWGVRRFEDANGHLTPAGKRRYAVQDARKYYKINRLQRAREKSNSDKFKKVLDGEIRRTQTRSDRKQALLSKKDIDVGREIVAKHRLNWAGANTAAKAALTAAGAYALYKNPETRALAPLAVAGGAALTYGSAKKIPYYFMENRRYKQGNEKGATKKGLTKKQQAIRTAGKVAAGAALAGVAGYALYKSGAGSAAINAGKNALEARTGIKFEKKSSGDSGKNSTPGAGHIPKSQHAKMPSTHYASDQIRKANRAASRKKAVKDTASNIGSTIKEKARSSARNKIMDGVDADNPQTWINAARNARDAVSNIRRYGRAIRKARKGDTAGAVVEVSDDLTNATNKIIEGTKSRIDKAKANRRNRKGKK